MSSEKKSPELNESEQNKSFGRKYPLPDIKTEFPVKINPLIESPLNKEWRQWVFESSNMSKEMFNKVKEVDLFYAHLYPLCEDTIRYECLVKQGYLLLIFDDHTETKAGDVAHNQAQSEKVWGQWRQMLDELQGKDVKTNEWKPYTFAMHSVMKSFYQYFNSEQKQRFLKFWNDYMQGNIEETQFLNKNKGFETVEEYNQIRFKSAAGMATLQLVEYSNQLVLSKEAFEDSRMKKIMEHGAFYIYAANDFFSFEKELKEAGHLDKTLNIVAVISRVDNLSIYESMEKLKDMMYSSENEIFKLEEELINEPGCLQTTKDYINGMKHFFGGVFEATRIMDRYNKIE